MDKSQKETNYKKTTDIDSRKKNENLNRPMTKKKTVVVIKNFPWGKAKGITGAFYQTFTEN